MYLHKQTYVVTGGSAGIGFGIAAHLLQHNCSALYLLGKKEEHLQEAEEGLKAYGDISKVHTVQIELEDFHNVDQVAKDLASKLGQLDGLICNAGLGVGVYNETKADGIDSHMQVNHFSQFHLAMILLPLLQKTHDSRLVFQSSDLHRAISDSTVQFASVGEMNQDIGAAKLYNRSKLAQVLFVHGLAERKAKGELGFSATNGPWINATHPGGVSTDQQKQAVDAYGSVVKPIVKAMKPMMKDPVDEGCRPALFAATSQDVINEGIQGKYVSRRRMRT